MVEDDESPVDFAVAALREDGLWSVVPLPLRAADSLDGLVAALHQLPTDTGALGLVSLADDACLLLRVQGDRARMALSDLAAADDYDIAADAYDALEEMDAPDLDDDDGPGGDLSLLADLGVPAGELSAILGDPDPYPDEVLGLLARRLGFGEQFQAAVDGTL